MSLELENRVAELERKARATRVLLDAAIVEIKAAHARLVAIETRMNAPPVTINMRPGGLVARRDVYGDAKPSLAPPAACHVDHDACSAEQRSSAGQAAQGPCERGVVDLVAASADDQHAAERGTPAAGAEVTASEGGDTARADSAVAELREVVGMLVKADEYERKAAALDPFDSMRRAPLMYEAKDLRREAEKRIAATAIDGLRARLEEARGERDAANAKVESMRRGVREMEAERDAVRHELAELRAELERERVRADYTAHVSAERRKWAVAIASALAGADRSGCESFVSREEMAYSVAAMRVELERERKLRRESEEAFKAANDMRNEPNTRSRAAKLEVGSRVRLKKGPCRGVVVGWDEDGDPMIDGFVNGGPFAWFADDVSIDTEATT